MGTDDQKNFYNNESNQYSKKRYEGALVTYVQFLFRRRLTLFLRMLAPIVDLCENNTVLEIGCADGIILKNIEKTFPGKITKMVGVDVSDGMIEQARQHTVSPIITYALRGDEPREIYDIVLELGVHTDDVPQELVYIKRYMKKDAYFIYSVASSTSLHAHFKLKDTTRLSTYAQVESIFAKHFTLVKSVPYGLFIPKLWAIPVLGRVLQPVFDVLFRHITPNLFHEKIYLLKNK